MFIYKYLDKGVWVWEYSGIGRRTKTMTKTLTAEILAELGKPFPASVIKKNYNGLDYISVGDVIKRLNDVVGADGWSAKYEEINPTGTNLVMRCELTVLGHTHTDFGEAAKETEPVKASASDSLKRAARMFGIGLHLYLREGGAKQQPAKPVTPVGRPPTSGYGGPR